MVINKILICGSSFLTKKVVDHIKDDYDIVGYIPSKNHILSVDIDLPIVNFDVEYDILLSIQYDQKISDVENSYNLHTGLLPDWGGCDILYHTLKNGAKKQGLTFHKITDKFDEGQIISKISYDINDEDTMLSLYKNMVNLSPRFVIQCLRMLESLSKEDIDKIPIYKPTLYKRGNIEKEDMDLYREFPSLIKKEFLI